MSIDILTTNTALLIILSRMLIQHIHGSVHICDGKTWCAYCDQRVTRYNNINHFSEWQIQPLFYHPCQHHRFTSNFRVLQPIRWIKYGNKSQCTLIKCFLYDWYIHCGRKIAFNNGISHFKVSKLRFNIWALVAFFSGLAGWCWQERRDIGYHCRSSWLQLDW